MKYHVNLETGKVSVCKANLRACPIGGEHFETKLEAQSYFELTNYHELFPENPSRDIIDHKISVEQAFAYGQWSALNRYLHNSHPRDPMEENYYSSPIGLLELERRAKIEGAHFDESKKLKEKLVKNGLKKIALSDSDLSKFNKASREGEQLIESYNKDDYTPDFRGGDRRDLRVEAYLSSMSNNWLKKLKLEEIETISHATSSGFQISEFSRLDKYGFDRNNFRDMRPFVNLTNDDIDDYEEYLTLERKSYLDFSKNFNNTFKKAVSKAPILDKPFKTYRGIKKEELIETFGGRGMKTSDIIKNIQNGKFNEQMLSRKSNIWEGSSSRLSHAPLSTTIKPNRVLNFSDSITVDNDEYDVIYQIEAKTMATPVNVGAWSGGEGEVYTNPNSDYKVKGYELIESDEDKVFMIKLEEIVN